MQHLILFFRQPDWDTPLGWIILFLLILLGAILIYLIGPLPVVAYGLQYWAARSSRDWKDRWASVRGSAAFFGLLFLLVCLFLLFALPFFRPAFSAFWQQFPLRDGFTVWPPVATALIARWLLPLPLAPLLALTLERLHPLTHHPLIRILLPAEKAQMQKRAEEAARQVTELAAEQAAAQAAVASPEPDPKPKTQRKRDASKATKKRLYPPKRKSSQQPSLEDATQEDESTKQDTKPSTQDIPSASKSSTKKIDWSRVKE